MDSRLIIYLQRRTLAEYAVLMTVCAFGALFVGITIAGMVSVESSISARGQLGIIWTISLLLLGFLWLHFRLAARRAHLAPSSTALFHVFQGVALVMGAVLILVAGKAGWYLFAVVSFGVEVAVGLFFGCYLFLAATLCRRFPLSAVVGLAGAIVGIAFTYQDVLRLDFGVGNSGPAAMSATPVHRHMATPN
ncbi:MAG TPA: hypothetical protein VGM54_10510 [Chthoniobacter sp.]